MKKPKFSLGVEVGDSFLRFALLETGKRHVLAATHYGVNAHPLRETAIMEQKLAEWVQRVPDGLPESITLTLSAGHCPVRRVTLPADADDTPAYLRWEFANSLSSSPDEYVFDYHLAKGSGKGAQTALVVGLRRAWMDSLVSGIRRRDLLPTQLELDAFSLANLLEADLGAAPSDGTAIIKAEREGILVFVFQEGLPDAVRWVSTLNVRSGFDGPSAQQIHSRLAQETLSILARATFHIGLPEAAPRKAYLCGGLALESNFVQGLRDVEGLDLEVWQNFRSITTDAEGAPTSQVIQCAAAIGACLRQAGDKK